MNTRIPIDSATRRAVYARDGRACRKCSRRDALDMHHIQPVVEGGTNEPENLIALCRKCHSEWHHVVRPFGMIPLERWLELPPAVLVLYWLAYDETPEIDSMTFSEAKEFLMTAFKLASR